MRRAAAVMAMLLGTAFVFVGFGRAARADPPAPLGVYTLVGDATGVLISEDEPSANAHPEAQGSAPETSSLLTNGPLGYGLAAIGWPGATGGNAGGLVTLLFPGPVGNETQQLGVHFPDAVTALVDQNAALLDYPVRAEARSGSHQDATYTLPNINLKSHADGTNVDSTATINGASQPGQVGLGDTHTESVSKLVGDAGRVTATSTATNIDIAGVVKIGSITSLANAQTNGITSSANGDTTVTKMTIGGVPAYVDKTGVHIGSVGENPVPALEQVAKAALDNIGMTIAVSNALVDTKGPATSYTAGSLIMLWHPPHAANVIVASFGGARASVSGSPGFALPNLVPPLLPPPADVGNTTATQFAPGGTVTLPPQATPIPATASRTPRRATRSPSGALSLITARTFNGIKVGWVVLGLAGVGLLYAGSRRLALDLLDRPMTTCPLETGP